MEVKMYRLILFVGLTIGTTAEPPDCKSVGSGKYPGETCNQYYECIKTVWWYNIKSQVCQDGQIFDPITENCVDGSCSKSEVTATTQPPKKQTKDNTATTSSPTTPEQTITDIPPNCKLVGAGDYPAKNCNQYYRCVKKMWWYNVELQTCPDGQIFNLNSGSCIVGSCSPTITETPTAAEITPNPDIPPNCKLVGAGDYPAENCNQYYRCAKKIWWYNVELQTCPDGQIFNSGSRSCTVGSCSPTATSPPTVTTPKPDIPPNCKLVGAGDYPAENCNQYYRCAKTIWWYNVELQTCPDGQIFNSGSRSCTVGSCSPTGTSPPAVTTPKPDILPNCKLVGAGNYPAKNCNQYYRCAKKMWWYNVELQTCPEGQIFDSSSRSCTVGSCSPTGT